MGINWKGVQARAGLIQTDYVWGMRHKVCRNGHKTTAGWQMKLCPDSREF